MKCDYFGFRVHLAKCGNRNRKNRHIFQIKILRLPDKVEGSNKKQMKAYAISCLKTCVALTYL